MEAIREAIRGDEWVFSLHAIGRLAEREIRPTDLIDALPTGEIIEDYPADPRGPSALVLAHLPDGAAVHAVCGRDRAGRLAIITAYVPSLPDWLDERTRAG